MEEEATRLKQFQADVDEEMNLSSSSLPGAQSPQILSQDEKREIDSRSIYVGNVGIVPGGSLFVIYSKPWSMYVDLF